MPITTWPKEDRPREKLHQKGEHSLTNAELIAIFLNTGIRGKSALDLAKELLVEHGGLKQLLSAPASALTRTPGVGMAKYASLKAALELGRRFIQDITPAGKLLNSPQAAQTYLAAQLRHHRNEVFACLFLDTHCRLIAFEELFHGTVNAATVYPREILRCALQHHAVKVILAHNHPSGHPLPSQADKDITQLIQKALALVDIDVVDHVVIGNPDNYSFAAMGLI